jgi:hypothetical protein
MFNLMVAENRHLTATDLPLVAAFAQGVLIGVFRSNQLARLVGQIAVI